MAALSNSELIDLIKRLTAKTEERRLRWTVVKTDTGETSPNNYIADLDNFRFGIFKTESPGGSSISFGRCDLDSTGWIFTERAKNYGAGRTDPMYNLLDSFFGLAQRSALEIDSKLAKALEAIDKL